MAGVALFALVIPALLGGLGVPQEIIAHSFPEEIGVLPVLILGWIPALVCVVAMKLLYTASNAYLRRSDLRPLSSGLRRIVQPVAAVVVRSFGGSRSPRKAPEYPKWVGILLGSLLWGSAHFLSGRRRAGLVWFFSLSAWSFLTLCLLAGPGRWSWSVAFLAASAEVVLWLVMLRQSYRPVRRIGVLGWLTVILVTVSADLTAKTFGRHIVEAFTVSANAMAPTIKGIHAREVAEGQEPQFRLVKRLWCGERYVRWHASASGTLAGPYVSSHLYPLAEFRVGADSRLLPYFAELKFKPGDPVHRGDLIWSGYIVAGDRVLVEKISYLFRTPRGGELVVFRAAGIVGTAADDTVYVQRIVGLPGQRVQIKPPYLIVNGEAVVEPSVFAMIASKENGYAGFLSGGGAGASTDEPSEEWVLGDDEYFVLGDNQEDSEDSRYFGPVPGKNIVGRVTRIYWPFNRVNALEEKR